MINLFCLAERRAANGAKDNQFISPEELSTEANFRRDLLGIEDNKRNDNRSHLGEDFRSHRDEGSSLSSKPKSKSKSNSESESKQENNKESNKENNKENNKERRMKSGNQYNDGKFIYSWKSETNSWIIGDTSRSSTAANAIYNGDHKSCPDEIIIKGRFNPSENGGNNVGNSEVKEGPVEEVGIRSFFRCGFNSNTTKVVVPKEVKIIREYGFSWMDKVTNFTIEIGSQLELIEQYGLANIGYYEDRTDSNNFSPDLKNLILPHTLKSVNDDGIYCCNRFTRIIYCGNHNLNQYSSQLESSNKNNLTKVYITPDYRDKNGNSIFGREASGVLSINETETLCSRKLPRPTPSPSHFPLLYILLPLLLLSLHINSSLVVPCLNSLTPLFGP